MHENAIPTMVAVIDLQLRGISGALIFMVDFSSYV